MARVEIDPGIDAAIRDVLVEELRETGKAAAARVRQTVPRDTGALAASIEMDLDERGLAVSIGTPLLHGRFVEIGTSKMAPRAPIRSGVLQALGASAPAFSRQSFRKAKRK